MGQTKTKVIETALDPEKAKQLEDKLKIDDAASGEAPGKKAAKKTKKAKIRSNSYKKLIEMVDKSLVYDIGDALALLKKEIKVKFDASVEAHFNLNTDSEKAEHQIRLLVSLPHMVAKKLRLLVFTSKSASEVKKLGAEVGTEATLKSIEAGKVDFDKVIADSSWMPKLAKVAKVLGPKGLMPSPKSGTVSDDPIKAVEDISGGQIEVKTEKNPIVHTVIGKISMSEAQLSENFFAILAAINEAKPAGVKKELIRSIFISASMSPSIKVSGKKKELEDDDSRKNSSKK